MSASPKIPVYLVQHPTDRFYFALNQNDPAILRADVEALVESALVDCEVWVAEAPDGQIASVAIWIPVGKAIMGTPGKDKYFTKILTARAPELNEWHDGVLNPVRARRNEIPKVNMSNGGYIALFTTHPAYRQRGLGSAVVHAVKERAEKIMVVTHDSEIAQNFWGQLGFEVGFQEEVKMPDGRLETYYALVYEKHQEAKSNGS